MPETDELTERRMTWIRALESGEYRQHQGELYNHFVGYCCIGVGGKVGPTKNIDAPPFSDNVYGKLAQWCDYKEGHLGTHLVTMNDDRNRDFKFIARFLRKVWGLSAVQ